MWEMNIFEVYKFMQGYDGRNGNKAWAQKSYEIIYIWHSYLTSWVENGENLLHCGRGILYTCALIYLHLYNEIYGISVSWKSAVDVNPSDNTRSALGNLTRFQNYVHKTSFSSSWRDEACGLPLYIFDTEDFQCNLIGKCEIIFRNRSFEVFVIFRIIKFWLKIRIQFSFLRY